MVVVAVVVVCCGECCPSRGVVRAGSTRHTWRDLRNPPPSINRVVHCGPHVWGSKCCVVFVRRESCCSRLFPFPGGGVEEEVGRVIGIVGVVHAIGKVLRVVALSAQCVGL